MGGAAGDARLAVIPSEVRNLGLPRFIHILSAVFPGAKSVVVSAALVAAVEIIVGAVDLLTVFFNGPAGGPLMAGVVGWLLDTTWGTTYPVLPVTGTGFRGEPPYFSNFRRMFSVIYTSGSVCRVICRGCYGAFSYLDGRFAWWFFGRVF